MPYHPANIRGGKHGLTRITTKDETHRACQCHRITSRIALHTLGFASGARGIQNIRGMSCIDPLNGHFGIEVLLTLCGVIQIAIGYCGVFREASVHNQHFFGFGS